MYEQRENQHKRKTEQGIDFIQKRTYRFQYTQRAKFTWNWTNKGIVIQ